MDPTIILSEANKYLIDYWSRDYLQFTEINLGRISGTVDHLSSRFKASLCVPVSQGAHDSVLRLANQNQLSA